VTSWLHACGGDSAGGGVVGRLGKQQDGRARRLQDKSCKGEFLLSNIPLLVFVFFMMFLSSTTIDLQHLTEVVLVKARNWMWLRRRRSGQRSAYFVSCQGGYRRVFMFNTNMVSEVLETERKSVNISPFHLSSSRASGVTSDIGSSKLESCCRQDDDASRSTPRKTFLSNSGEG
jgi:hypothetical protein